MQIHSVTLTVSFAYFVYTLYVACFLCQSPKQVPHSCLTKVVEEPGNRKPDPGFNGCTVSLSTWMLNLAVPDGLLETGLSEQE